MTEKDQAYVVLSRKAVFVRGSLKISDILNVRLFSKKLHIFILSFYHKTMF